MEALQNNFLLHYGVDGTRWYTHRFGKWQPQARYANGRYEDGTKYNNPATVKDIKKARRDAKNDYRIQMIDRGSIPDTAKLVMKKAAIANVLAGPIGAALYTSFSVNKAINSYNSRSGDNASYLTLGSRKRQLANADKSLHKRISKSKAAELKLSDEYVKEYSKAMDEMIKANGVKKVRAKTNFEKKLDEKAKSNENLRAVKDLLDSIGIAAPSATLTNLLMTKYITKGASLAGDLKTIAKPIIQSKLGKFDSVSGLPMKAFAGSEASDMANVNPARKGLILGKLGSGNNCGECTAAYELRRRGYDVSAKLNLKGHSVEDTLKLFPNAKHETLLSNQNGASLKQVNDIIDTIAKQGSGARGDLTVTWKNGWGGHSLNYEVTDAGKVIFRDSQINKTYKDVTGYLLGKANSVDVTRLDNASFDPKVAKDFVSVFKR